MAKQDEGYDVFMSYSHKDSEIARQIASALSGKGLRVFYDESEIRIGDLIAKRKGEALEHSKYFLLLLSPDYVSSQWTNFELGVALTRELVGRKRRILPVIVREVDPRALPARLSNISAIKVGDYGIDEIASRLSDVIRQSEPENIPESA